MKCSLKTIRGGVGGMREGGLRREEERVYGLETHENSVLDSVIKGRGA